jgi:transposase
VGRCRAGKATKIVALADRHGLPLAIHIAGGNRPSVLTEGTLDSAFVEELPPRLIGDKAWDNAPLQQRLAEERGIELIAPKRGGKRPSKRKQDGRSLRRYKRRWKVERLFAWLKRWRRIGTRWERKAENYLAFLQLGCAVLLLRRACKGL